MKKEQAIGTPGGGSHAGGCAVAKHCGEIMGEMRRRKVLDGSGKVPR